MKKVGIVSLVAVIAFGVLGVAYAAWSENVAFGGSLTTGTFNPVLTNVTASDNEQTDLATIVISNQTPASFTVTLTNVYPGYVGRVYFTVDNSGTSIPTVITPAFTTSLDDLAPYVTITFSPAKADGSLDASAAEVPFGHTDAVMTIDFHAGASNTAQSLIDTFVYQIQVMQKD